MPPARPKLEHLRRQLAALETPAARRIVLSTGLAAIDRALPWGGLPVGALHDIDGGVGDVAAVGFAAAVAAAAQRRCGGRVLWCRHRRTVHDRGAVYAPGLTAWGLHPRHVVFTACNSPGDVLWAMEEGLRARGFAAVVGDGVAPDFTAARRLQLSGSDGTAIALAIQPAATSAPASHSPALTRWRITALPTATDNCARNDPALTPRAWRVELLHCRGAAPRAWAVRWDHFENREIADAPLSGAVATPLADGPVAARSTAVPGARRTAAGR